MPSSGKYVGKGYGKEFIKLILPCISHILSVEPHLAKDAGAILSQIVSPRTSSQWRVIERSFDNVWFFHKVGW